MNNTLPKNNTPKLKWWHKGALVGFGMALITLIFREIVLLPVGAFIMFVVNLSVLPFFVFFNWLLEYFTKGASVLMYFGEERTFILAHLIHFISWILVGIVYAYIFHTIRRLTKHSQKNKGQPGFVLPIAILIAVVLIIAGGAGYYFYKTSQEEKEVKIPEVKVPEEVIKDENIKEDLDRAKETLINFFSYLHDKQFDKAVSLFEPEYPDSWEGLAAFSLPEDRNDRVKVLAHYCESVGTCLRVKVLSIEKVFKNEFKLKVQFIENSGEIYVYGPCCGATEEQMPSTKEFDYKVKKIDGVYKVVTVPLYRP